MHRWDLFALVALSVSCAGSSAPLAPVPTAAGLQLDACWESGPARDSDFGCSPVWVLYEDGSFQCGERSGHLSRRAANRVREVAEELLRQPAGGEFDTELYLRRLQSEEIQRLTPSGVEALERATSALREQCGLTLR